MKNEFQPEKLKITKDLKGMSLKSIQEHFKLYEGYVKKTNEIQKKLETAEKSEANGVYSAYGELRRQETFAVNGMKLHEVYFGHLGEIAPPQVLNKEGGVPPEAVTAASQTPPRNDGLIKKMIEKEFGSVEAWKEGMVATGLSARGWAILAFDFKDNRLHIYGSDAQNVGAVWGAIPLVALDVYEHAYFMDHGTNRKAYLEGFFKNLNWETANVIIKEHGLDKKHNK